MPYFDAPCIIVLSARRAASRSARRTAERAATLAVGLMLLLAPAASGASGALPRAGAPGPVRSFLMAPGPLPVTGFPAPARRIPRIAPLASDDRLLGPDKAQHFVVSAALVGAIYRVYHGELHNDASDSRLVAAGGTGAIGVAKEMHDARFSHLDLVADAAGIAVGWLFLTR